MIKFFCSSARWLSRSISIQLSQRGFKFVFSNHTYVYVRTFDSFWLPVCWLRGRSPIRLSQLCADYFNRDYSEVRIWNSRLTLFFLLSEIAAARGFFAFFNQNERINQYIYNLMKKIPYLLDIHGEPLVESFSIESETN